MSFGKTLLLLSTLAVSNAALADFIIQHRVAPIQEDLSIPSYTPLDICHSSGSAFVVKQDNTLWGIGSNSYGQLGLSSAVASVSNWTQLATGVERVFCGYSISLSISKTDGSFWVTGYNNYGKLGIGTEETSYEFKDTGMTGVTEAISTAYNTVIHLSDKSVWVAGNRGLGIFGGATGDNTQKTFQQVASNVDAITSGVGNVGTLSGTTVRAQGYNIYGQSSLGSEGKTSGFPVFMTGVSKVMMSKYGILFLKTDNTLWAKGNNQSGELSTLSEGTQPLQQVASNVIDFHTSAEHQFTHILKADGTVWASGRNTTGWLGSGDESEIPNFTQIGVTGVTGFYDKGGFPILKKADGTLWVSGGTVRLNQDNVDTSIFNQVLLP